MTVRLTSDGKRVLDVSQGTEQQKRQMVERYIPREKGVVTFLKSGQKVESVYTSDVKQIAFERYCGYFTPNFGYADKIIVSLGEQQGMEMTIPQNQIYNPW